MARRFPQKTRLLQQLANAIDQGNPKKLAEVLKRGVDINAPLKGSRGAQTPFQRAMGCNGDIALALLDAGAKLEADHCNLVWAVTTGRADVVRKFIDLGADVNFKSFFGTPIYEAARKGEAEMVRLLIDAGADINAGAGSGSSHTTPLYHAVNQNHTKAALLLIDAGAKRDVPRNSPSLLRTAQSHENDALIKALSIGAPAETPLKPKPAKNRLPANVKAAEPITPDFPKRSRAKSYRTSVKQLQALCGTAPERMKHAPGGYQFHLRSSKRQSFDLQRAHEQFLEQGAYVFTTNAIQPHKTIAILPTTDVYEVLAAMCTSGTNYDVSNEDVIAFMREVEKDQSFVLTGIHWDFLDGHFTSKIKDPAGLAKWMVKFCPDLDDEKALAKHLRTRSPRLFFWWD